MAIYRGAGGAGDATNDATSQAILAAQSAQEAAASEAAAASSASSAATSASNAASSATSAASSATSASNSASSATTQAANAASSAATAATKASEAATSATNAASSATSAATSATNASNSATAAANSATSASNSASAASTSASNAATYASNAATSATNAATSETNAAASANSASNSATSAAASATSAGNSASSATTSATNAANSASAAATSASNAATSATNAASSATSAASSASTATTQATNAANSASAAATSATNAANSASAASTSATNAANSASAAADSATEAAGYAASINPTNFLQKANNLSDLTNAATARDNLGVEIGTDVQAYSATLASYANGATLGFKNRIINGAMMIDQRNAGASVTPTTSGTYLVDRFNSINNQPSKLTYQQSTTVPSGFKNSLSITTASAYTPATSETFGLRQHIEGFNIADLGFGTASAQTVTLSFWVRSSLTGTFGGTLMNNAGNRFYVFSYSISAANTWEQKIVTIAGDTTGTWETGNLAGITLTWSVGTGATLSGAAGSWGATTYYGVTGGVQPVATSGATFYITGVQLEKGSTATSFDYRPYGTELALCQRYYWVVCRGDNQTIANGCAFTASEADGVIQYPVQMRANPSLDQTTGSAYYNFRAGGGGATFNSFSSIDASTINIRIYGAVSTTANAGGYFKTNAAGCYVALSSEL